MVTLERMSTTPGTRRGAGQDLADRDRPSGRDLRSTNWELLYFWPVWVIGPWGAVLLAQAITGGSQDDDNDGEDDGE